MQHIGYQPPSNPEEEEEKLCFQDTSICELFLHRASYWFIPILSKHETRSSLVLSRLLGSSVLKAANFSMKSFQVWHFRVLSCFEYSVPFFCRKDDVQQNNFTNIIKMSVTVLQYQGNVFTVYLPLCCCPIELGWIFGWPYETITCQNWFHLLICNLFRLQDEITLNGTFQLLLLYLSVNYIFSAWFPSGGNF